MIRRAAFVSAVVLLGVAGGPLDNPFASPVVESISRVVSKQTQTIVITGRHFGYNQPYDGDSSYLWMVDVEVGSAYWRAGCPQQYGPCTTTLNVSSWTDNQIVITEFTGYGQYPKSGDLVNFFIWNPQTGRGPAAAARIVR
jgi:hypothetical protein